MAMLEVKDLRVRYGVIPALKGISFHVDEGEIIALIGANGAGKTTTLHTITGLVEKAGGSVAFLGKDITKTPAHQIVEMGIAHVPEGRRVFPEMTVYQNLMLGAYTRKDAKEKAALLQDAVSCAVSAKSAAEYEVQAGTGAVHHDPEQEVLLLLVYAGEGRGTRLSHYIEQMKICHAVPDGIILAGADGRFLSQYYQEEKTKG